MRWRAMTGAGGQWRTKGTGGRVSIVPWMFLKGQWPRPLCPANKQMVDERKNGERNEKEEPTPIDRFSLTGICLHNGTELPSPCPLELNPFNLTAFGPLLRLPTLKHSCCQLCSKASYGWLARPCPMGFPPTNRRDLARSLPSPLSRSPLCPALILFF